MSRDSFFWGLSQHVEMQRDRESERESEREREMLSFPSMRNVFALVLRGLDVGRVIIKGLLQHGI